MTRARERPPGPPRDALAALRFVLPSDPVRDAIVGDLHEEFVRDAARLGLRGARRRYRRRAAEIVAHAAWDSLCWRSWESTAPEEPARPPEDARALPRPGDVTRELSGAYARARRGGLGLAVLAFVVIGVAAIANTLLFTAVDGPSPSPVHEASILLSALGLGGVVLLLACASLAAALICAGARRRRTRHQDRVSITYPQ